MVTVLHPFRSPCLHPVRLRCCEQTTNIVCVRECVCVLVFVLTQKSIVGMMVSILSGNTSTRMEGVNLCV